MDKKPALGRGLSALIPHASEALAAPRTPTEVDIDLLEPNEFQPRGPIAEGALDDLAQSIRANGVIQPVVVRRLANGRYQIIAGERRWRAAQRAGLLKIPLIVKDVPAGDRKRLLEMALIENIQREDLNAIEEAQAYQRLIEEFGLRQEDVATQVGKDRSTVANHLRLLKLPEQVRLEIAGGRLSMGHARALAALSDPAEQTRLGQFVIAQSLSVRETELLIKKAVRPGKPQTSAAATADVHTRAAEEQLRLALGTGVAIRRQGSGGRLEISFRDEGELQRLYERLTDSRGQRVQPG